jgi:glutathione S-transferase
LYHYALCPFSRKVRVLLGEKGLRFELIEEQYWKHRREFALLNPAMQVPVLEESSGIVVADSNAICEYLDAKYVNPSFFGRSLEEAAEIRRLVSWFDQKMFTEVGRYLINEKVIRYYGKEGEPNSEVIRVAKMNLVNHLEYITYLMRERKWLAGDDISMADIAAAAHFSILDYLNEVAWDEYPYVRQWYAVLKSRPSFRPLLADRVAGFPPSKHYANPDF